MRDKVGAMKLSVLAAVAALALSGTSASGCKGPTPSRPQGPPAAAARYSATRWVPANPSYVLASPTVREAQRSLREAIEVLAMPMGVEVSEVGRDLSRVLAVDPLSPEAVVEIGIDLEGGIAVFSEDIAPTFVFRLAAPEQMQAFLDRQRERGMVTQSVIVDKAEVFTARLGGDVSLSWAIVEDWMWLHVTPPVARHEGTAWFSASYRPDAPAWAGDWQWAESAGKLARPTVVGFLDAKQVIGRFVARVPEAMQCAKLVEPLERVGLAIEADGTAARARIAFEVGGAAASVAAAQLAVPEGFEAVAAGAPLAAQWNLDVFAVRDWLRPCVRTIDRELASLDRAGVRAGRGALLHLDPEDKKGAGVIALELSHARFFRGQLDDIPLRSTLERSRKFGPHAGHSLSIPFVASVDYVLTEKLALAGVGDGLLAKLVGGGNTVPGPIAAIDVIPAGLSAETWETVLGQLGLPRARRVVERMSAWKDGHLRLEVEGNALVFTAAGTRR